jgi:hypothetical protein
MIDTLLKLTLIILLIFIFQQDIKDRLVYWFLYPLVGGVAFSLKVINTGFMETLITTAVNLGVILLLLFVAYLYAVLIMKWGFINESIGMGDILLFVFLPFTFTSITFVVLLVFSLFFYLVLHMVLSRNKIDKTVPLAGYISLFFAMVYIASFFTEPKYLFSY